MADHIIIEMGFEPIIRQNALSKIEWSKILLPPILVEIDDIF